MDTFEKCMQQTRHTLSYNGDITSVAKFHEMAERFPSINHWLIGRGLIADPFLPRMIKNNTTDYPENRIEIFRKFHDTLFQTLPKVLRCSKKQRA
jgi:tRNA-dihydrouridine synthase